MKPATLRGIDVRRAYYSAAQGPNQRVHSFAKFLEELKDQMDPFTEKQRCKRLFFGLRESITDQILEKRGNLDNRNRLINLATLVEQTQEHIQPRNDSGRSRTATVGRLNRHRPGFTSSTANSTPIAGRPNANSHSTGQDKSQIKCHICH